MNGCGIRVTLLHLIFAAMSFLLSPKQLSTTGYT